MQLVLSGWNFKRQLPFCSFSCDVLSSNWLITMTTRYITYEDYTIWSWEKDSVSILSKQKDKAGIICFIVFLNV